MKKEQNIMAKMTINIWKEIDVMIIVLDKKKIIVLFEIIL